MEVLLARPVIITIAIIGAVASTLATVLLAQAHNLDRSAAPLHVHVSPTVIRASG